MVTVRPLGDRVLVEVIGRDRVTTGGVVLPENVREESDRGLVLAVGPGGPLVSAYDRRGSELPMGEWAQTRPVAVEPGEVVVFSPYAGSKVAVGDDDYLLLRESDILGVLEGVTVEEENGERRIREAVAV